MFGVEAEKRPWKCSGERLEYLTVVPVPDTDTHTMAPAKTLQRNVRPKRIPETDYEHNDVSEDLDESIASGASDEDSDNGASSVGSGSADDAEQNDSEISEDDAAQQLTNVSFGALKRANDSLSRKRKRGSDVTDEQEDKLAALRRRLRQIREEKEKAAGAPSSNPASKITRATASASNNTSNSDDEDDSDSAPSEVESGGRGLSRTSKHAPTAQSSTHQVTRKRTVVDVPKSHVRDPRFDALTQNRSAHPGNNPEAAYSFLRDYQTAEIAELKAALKKTRDEDDKAVLRRKVNSMENRLKAHAAKEREQEVLRQHRREEKVRVGEGKTPFYLKKKDLKERVLVEKFKGMKGKEREKLVEKRRKKEGQKEKRMMPRDRRMAA